MTQLSPEEMQRMIINHEKILNSDNSRFLRRDLYDSKQGHMAEDIAEIKDTLKWGMRLVMAEFLGLIVGLVVMLVALS